MRNTFIEELTRSAEQDPKIFLVVGDLGYSVVEPFAERFPERFLNAGIAEQNMTGVAAGLAMAGYKVFTYSIANFPTLRCLEQIRNDVCYHNLDVTVVAVGGGLGYGSLGYSHHAVQDIACMRCLPGIKLLLPSSPEETKLVTEWKVNNPGPSYLRLGKGGEANFGSSSEEMKSGLRLVHKGERNALIAVGSILGWAGSIVADAGGSVYTLPVWEDNEEEKVGLIDMLSSYDRIVVCEEHLLAGGIGSMIREILESRPALQDRIRCVALPKEACGLVGEPQYIRETVGVNENGLLKQFLN